MKYLKILVSPLILLFVLALAGCTSNPKLDTSNTNHPLKYSTEHAVSQWTDDKKYHVTLHSNLYPLKMGKIHSWTVKVLYPDGKPVEQAKIYIHGGMPQHQHGFPTHPRVNKYLGDGVYRIDGIKFTMPGDWQIRINVKEETRRDRAVFNVVI